MTTTEPEAGPTQPIPLISSSADGGVGGETGSQAGSEAGRWGWAALARIGLVIAAAVAVAASAPTPVIATLSLLALVVVAERLARLRERGPMDAVLMAAGGTLIALILIGLLLGVTHIGLRPASWAITLGVLGVAGLVATEQFAPAGSRRRPHWLRPPSGGLAVWGLASTAVVVLALVVSVHATNQADVAPVQMSFGKISPASVQIVVSSDKFTGELELRTQTDDGTSISYPLFDVQPGRSRTTSVVVPETGRLIITLNNPDQSAPLRSLILDR